MKIFHFKEKLVSLPRDSELILPPLHVRIKPTNVCNHKCRYCAYRSEDLQLGQNMNLQDFIPLEKMLEIIDDLAVMGVRAITFSGGGDPFCYPYLLEAVERIAGTNIRFAALTNGSKLTGRVAELFASHATWLRISMDGWDDESYMKYRGCPDGEFSRILANMEAFKTIGGGCNLGVSLVIDHENCSHIFSMIQRLHDVGVDSVKVSPCIVSNNGEENNDYHLPIFTTVKDQIARAVTEFKGEKFEIFDSYHTQLATFAKSYQWCPYLQIRPVIGADLNVYSCNDKAYNLAEGVIGSLLEKRFEDFWLLGKDKFFHIDPASVCNHHCVADSSNRQIHEYLEADPEHLDFV
jgi:MoaA/NifB/PqqE/SkfB family radical SAM enzyme